MSFIIEPPYTRPVRTVVVCHERRIMEILRSCVKDEGGPLEAGIPVQASNRLMRLYLKGRVVSDKEKVL